ncbi:unnamed protein product [Prunus armeniaca]
MASNTSASVEAQSQVFQTVFEDICREAQGSVLPDIVAPWADDDSVSTDSCLLGPSVEGGMPERLAVHLKDNLVDLSAFDQGDYQDWNVKRPQQQWLTSTSDWEKWLPRMEHFFSQQWKAQGIYHLIKLFDRSIVMDRSLLAAALSFWSSATNTMNLRFGMMTPTVLDTAVLFGLSPLGVEVNAALVAPEAVGSFKAAWPTLTRLAGSKAKNMLNYSSFYNNFSANKVTLEFTHLADYLAQGGRLTLGPFLLGHIYRVLHDVVTDGMKPKHGGPLWAFQFLLQAFFPKLIGATTVADTKPLARAPRKHNTMAFYFKFFYELTERTGSQFWVCLARPYPLFLAHDLSVIPDGKTENELREIWGSFLVARDLHCGLSKVGAEVYLPHCVAQQFGLIQTVPLFPLSTNRLSSWRANVSQSNGVAWISFQLQKGMTFLTLRPWKRRNVFDEDGRVWYEDFISASGVKGRRPQPRFLGRVPRLWATTVVGARRTLAHRTVPSPPLVLSSIFLSFVANFILSLEAPGHKRSREAAITETAAVEAVPVGSAAAEVEVPELPRKRVLLILSEGEDEEEVPTAAGAAVDAEVVAAEAPVVKETFVEALGTEAVITEVAVGKGIVTEATTGEAAVAEATAGEAEATTVEMVVAEVPSVEAAAVEVPSAEAAAPESRLAALTGPPFAVVAVPSLAAMVPVGPPPVTPRRPSGIVIHSVSVCLACQSPFLTWVFLTFDFRLQPPRASLPLTVAVVSAAMAVTQEPLAEDDTAVVEPLATATPILTPTSRSTCPCRSCLYLRSQRS